MADEVPAEQLAEAMYELVKDCQGKRKLKSLDLQKAMKEKFGDGATKPNCKAAVRQLIDSGRCVYTYFGGSFVELPPDKQE